MKEFLESRGYIEYPKEVSEMSEKTLYQKRVVSDAVCETNDKLHVSIEEFKWLVGEWHNSYQVSIVAERNQIWWDLKAYSLNADELKDKIEFLESTMVKLFNGI